MERREFLTAATAAISGIYFTNSATPKQAKKTKANKAKR